MDVVVKGDVAKGLIRNCEIERSNNPDAKVMITGRIGNIRPDVFTTKEGAVRPVLKASLYYIGTARVNGQVVYEAPKKE